MENVTI